MRFRMAATRALLVLLVIWLPLGHIAQAQQKGTESARVFVQSFYNWYLRFTDNYLNSTGKDKRMNYTPLEVVVKEKGGSFDANLLAALRRDIDAQNAEPGYIVGLDFDPFLNTQDPDDRYDVRKVTRKGEKYLVEVFGTRGGNRESEPSVVVELIRKNSRWVFSDFRYPNQGADLLGILAVLRTGRIPEQK